MRRTRTLAACVAATTLFGLLSATPALAAPPEPVPTTQPTPGSASPAQSTGVDVTHAGGEALVSLPDDVYRSEKRIVVIVEGRFVAQIQNQQTRGVSSVTPDAAGGRTILHIPEVKPGERVAVTEYLESMDSGFDDSLRRERLFPARRNAVAPTVDPTPTEPPAPAEPAPTVAPAPSAVPAPAESPAPPAPTPIAAPTPAASPAPAGELAPSNGVSAAAPVVTAWNADHQAVMLLPRELESPQKRVTIWVNGVKSTQFVNGLKGVLKGFTEGFRLGEYHGVDQLRIGVTAEPGDRVKVTVADVDGSDADRDAPERTLFDDLVQPAGASVVTASYRDERAIVLLPKELESPQKRVTIRVNGVKSTQFVNGLNGLFSGFTEGLRDGGHSGGQLQLKVLAAQGDRVTVSVAEVDAAGQASSEWVLLDKTV